MTADQAKAIANAVAESYIAYVGDKTTPVQHLVAELFQPATAATTPSWLESMLVAGLVGALDYWSANAITTQYLKSPGPLLHA